MAAHTCCDDPARAARGRKRLKLKRRRPSSTSSSLAKARRNLLRQTGSKPGALAPSRKKSVAIRRKMESLRRLVVVPPPVCGADGGSIERLDELLLHAAGYIMRLQMQVRVMQVMVHALNKPED
ncbi:hypothetical protein PR202_gb20433 [Eleusine coracana subsp. coracana]|uniref:Uncharacterized protein n=1 Tax=Eleusine coracana subsp. coracana TaxID=191504 RepID=A0AAV5FAT8_ELECO|nr:hypothetical protein QOZ80_1BG0064460 [Eleusine coracana subsp. coracana]GJN31969.1 hypothetical protein PR202_gb20433 [Eleusine coracana subsp. coracana]